MRVAVFTDADFDRATNITTTLAALLRHALSEVRPRIHSLSDLEVDEPVRVEGAGLRIPDADPSRERNR